MKVTVQTQVEVDLYRTRYEHWPEEAKCVARCIIDKRQQEFLRQLPELRQSWLVARVEAWLAQPSPLDTLEGD